MGLCKAEVTYYFRPKPKPGPGAPFDSQHSVQGTPTTRVLGHAHIQEASHHQRPTNPITEKEGVHGPQRDLARRPTASQRAARARAVCSAVGFGVQRLPRINASSTHAKRPAARPRARSQARHRRRRARAAGRARRTGKKDGPAPPQFVPFPGLQFDGPAGHDVVRPEHGADRALWYLWFKDSEEGGSCGCGVL